MISLGWMLIAPGLAWAQTAPSGSALLPAADMNRTCLRVTQLMESGGVAIPDLQRAAAPLIENARQACTQLQLRAGAGQPTYSLLLNLRAYLALSDAVPRPFPFPEVARLQFAELRETAIRLDSHFRELMDSKDRQAQNPDRDNLARYAESNRRLPPPNAARPRVVFFGDSITDLWRLNEYFPDRDFVNRGIGGQITGEMLGRIKADVLDLHPKAAVILAGTNDLARKIPLTAIEDNYLVMADLLSAYQIKAIFASVLPVSDYHRDANASYERTPGRPPALIKALNDWLARLCAQRGYTYVNYFNALVDAQGQFGADFADDGLHPNSKGYRLMAPLVFEAIQKTLAPPAAPAVPRKPLKR